MLYSQEKNIGTAVYDECIDLPADKGAEYLGGREGMLEYLEQNLIYPKETITPEIFF